IYVNVPRGALDGLKQQEQDRVVNACHDWLRHKIRALPSGSSMQTCHIVSSTSTPAVDLELQVRVVDDADFEGKPPLIRRYGSVNVGEAVEKALRAKLPKLVATTADKRSLMLERSQWSLDEKQIHDEIETRRPALPDLANIDEVWIVETVAATPDLTHGSIDFRHYVNRNVVENFWFRDGRLASRSKNGMPIP